MLHSVRAFLLVKNQIQVLKIYAQWSSRVLLNQNELLSGGFSLFLIAFEALVSDHLEKVVVSRAGRLRK